MPLPAVPSVEQIGEAVAVLVEEREEVLEDTLKAVDAACRRMVSAG
jgi:hypothetical protein